MINYELPDFSDYPDLADGISRYIAIVIYTFCQLQPEEYFYIGSKS
jgi:hypothetical protein